VKRVQYLVMLVHLNVLGMMTVCFQTWVVLLVLLLLVVMDLVQIVQQHKAVGYKIHCLLDSHHKKTLLIGFQLLQTPQVI